MATPPDDIGILYTLQMVLLAARIDDDGDGLIREGWVPLELWLP